MEYFPLPSVGKGTLWFWAIVVMCLGTATAAGASSQLLCSPCSVAFGTVTVGSSKSVPIVFTNSGNSAITISSKVKKAPWVSPSGLALPYTLPAGSSVTFELVYAPRDTRTVNGSFTYDSNATDPNLVITVTGSATAAGSLVPNPTTLNFGSVAVGSTKTLSASLSASGSSVTVKSASLGSSEYSLSGLALPVTLSAGQSVSFKVNFTPQSSGTANTSVTFASGTSNPAAQISLQGSGTGGTQHSVTLNWKASTSQVVGYNVYRGTASGGPYALISSSDAATSYSDTSVQAGAAYYYVVTAVNSSGQESVYSNQASASVP